MDKNKLLQDYFNSLVSDNIFPGCNYSIIDDTNIYLGSVGYKSLYPKELNNINTIYDIASLTKVVVTNMLLTKLLSYNLISLDDLVCKHIYEFKYNDITIMDLITHSSGLVSILDKNNIKDRNDFIKSLVRKYDRHKKIIYQDTNYILLGFIIEKIYDSTLDVIAREEIFKPLNMVSTTYNPIDKNKCAPTEYNKTRGLIQGIVHDEKALFLNGVCGSAGVFSNVFDLINFTNMVINNGIDYIDKKYLDLWFKSYINDDGCERGMGWLIGRSNRMCTDWCSNEAITHTGFTGTHISIDRLKRFAIILLSNRIHPNRNNDKIIVKRKEINNMCYNICRNK